MKTKTIMWVVAGIVALLLTPQLIRGINSLKEWWEAPPAPPTRTTNRSMGTEPVTAWILPTEIRRFATNGRRIDWNSSGTIAIRGIVIRDGVEYPTPLNRSRANREGWNAVSNSDPKLRADSGIEGVLTFVEVAVPPNCPASSFEIDLR